MMDETRPFLRIPPFPGARTTRFSTPATAATAIPDADVDRLVERIRQLRVGGCYWGSAEPAEEADRDPWTAAEQGREARDSDESLVAAIVGGADRSTLRSAMRERLLGFDYADPFTGKEIDAGDAIELCGFWRRLIDSNRDIAAAVGFAFWKRPTVTPLLWGGHDLRFTGKADEIGEGSAVAIWRARASDRLVAALETKGAALVEVEDGFIRSAGLGADCVPPLSIVVDRLNAHFNPARPSELERIIQTGQVSPDQVERARALRRSIVDHGLSKYDSATRTSPRRAGSRRHILVPGQVEDDRSVIEGGAAVATNRELLRRVREAAPDAYILYKPHPDVEAGHRVGRLSDSETLELADEVVRDEMISSLIAMVDEVHVNTSLAGFEALLRGKPVTVHGAPFYAGWGLTTDRGPVPSRRTARPSLDELVASVLLEYPRYLDPVTGLPCPAEVVVDRLVGQRTAQPNLIVGLRRVQGRIMRRFRSIVA